MKARYLTLALSEDALRDKKMAFISGPRQVGKTTIGKFLLKSKNNYFNWDQSAFKKTWAKSPEKILENIDAGPVLFDEIHKDRKWKSKIKGIYDSFSDQLEILVTGSAKLDMHRKGSESLMGRYIPYRLHPFSVSESKRPPQPDNILKQFKVSYKWKDLMTLGGYPEPLLSGSENKAQRWSRLRLDQMAFEDTRDIKVIFNINAFRSLLDFLPEKIGSLFSFNSLKEDIGTAYGTVRDWVFLAELLYYGFFIRPYSKGLKRALKAEPKFYIYDLLQIPKSDHAKRLENLTALHLLKACHFWTDTGAGLFELHFVRDKEKREVDFLITKGRKPWMLIECKSQSKQISPHLIYYSKLLKTKLNFQLIDKSNYDKKHVLFGIRVLSYEKFFSGLV